MEHLTDRIPTLTGEEIVAHLVPPRQFQDATLDSYRPDHDYPSQAEAVAAIREFVGSWKPGGLFSRRRTSVLPGIYLDGHGYLRIWGDRQRVSVDTDPLPRPYAPVCDGAGRL